MQINEECFFEGEKMCCLFSSCKLLHCQKEPSLSFNKLGLFWTMCLYMYLFLVKLCENYSFWYQNDNDILIFHLKAQRNTSGPYLGIGVGSPHSALSLCLQYMWEFWLQGWFRDGCRKKRLEQPSARDRQLLIGLQQTSVCGRTHAEGDNCEAGEAERSWYGLQTLNCPSHPEHSGKLGRKVRREIVKFSLKKQG